MNEHMDQIIEDIGEKRYEHSIRVMETAIKLAQRHGENLEQAKIAGYYHDCGKYKDKTKLLKMAEHFDIIKDNIMSKNMELIHAPLAAKLAKEYYGVADATVLKAIESHTTGNKNMSKLDKIVYLADYIEPKRNFPGVEIARELAFEDLDRAMLYALDNTIKFLIERKSLMSVETIEARNQMLENLDS